MKKIFARRFLFSSMFLVVALFFAIAAQSSHFVRAQTSSALTGYAWSDNIGWISFSGTSPAYGITEDSSGNLTGYAWSDNIGWIKFGGLSSFPTGTSTSNENALIDSGGTLHGWARACAGTSPGDCSSMTSRTDGWDGWISLDGANYGVNFASGNGQYSQSAYAWGSDVVGWITFNPSNLSSSTNPTCNAALETCGSGPSGLTPTVNLYINGGSTASVATGTAATLTWNTSNVTTCTESSSGTNGINSDPRWSSSLGSATSTGATSTSAFATTGTETYGLTCNQAGGQPLSANPVVLTVTGQTGNPGSNMCTGVPANATLCGSSANTSSTLVSSCPTSAIPACEYSCSSGYHQVGNECIGNGSLQEQ